MLSALPYSLVLKTPQTPKDRGIMQTRLHTCPNGFTLTWNQVLCVTDTTIAKCRAPIDCTLPRQPPTEQSAHLFSVDFSGRANGELRASPTPHIILQHQTALTTYKTRLLIKTLHICWAELFFLNDVFWRTGVNWRR